MNDTINEAVKAVKEAHELLDNERLQRKEEIELRIEHERLRRDNIANEAIIKSAENSVKSNKIKFLVICILSAMLLLSMMFSTLLYAYSINRMAQAFESLDVNKTDIEAKLDNITDNNSINIGNENKIEK